MCLMQHCTALHCLHACFFFFPFLSRERVQKEEDSWLGISYIPYYLARDLFFFLFSFLSFNDYLPPCTTLLRHKQVYVAFFVGNKV